MPSSLPEQYYDLTRDQLAHDSASKRLADARAKVLARMHADGLSYATIADRLGGTLTRARVQQLVERGRQLLTTEEG